jgi:hypothetical protein
MEIFVRWIEPLRPREEGGKVRRSTRQAVFGVIGLLRSNHWGFVFVYIYIVIATFVLSISVIPFLLGILDSRAKTATAVLFTINGAMFVFTVFLHVSKSRKLGRRAGRNT